MSRAKWPCQHWASRMKLQFSVKPIYKTLDLFLETVFFFYHESLFKQTWITTQLLMVKKPTLRSLGLPCAACARVWCEPVCVFICFWWCTSGRVCGIGVNHRAALSLIRQEQTRARIHNRRLSAGGSKKSTNQTVREAHQVCLLWQPWPAVAPVLWWADGHHSLSKSNFVPCVWLFTWQFQKHIPACLGDNSRLCLFGLNPQIFALTELHFCIRKFDNFIQHHNHHI